MRTLKVLFLFFLLLFSISELAAQSGQTAAQKYVPGHILVKFRPNTRSTAMQVAHLAVAGEVVRTFGIEGLQLVKVPDTIKLSTAIAAYRANPAV